MTAIQRLRKRTLGRTGLEVSPIALGGASFGYVHRSANWDPYSKQGRATAIATLNHGQDLGINYIDTAPLYGNGQSETLIGEVVARRRQECVLATKVWFELDQQGVIESVEDSMRRLQTDHLDIVQIHGRIYSASDHDRVIRKDGPLDGLRTLREAGERSGSSALRRRSPSRSSHSWRSRISTSIRSPIISSIRLLPGISSPRRRRRMWPS